MGSESLNKKSLNNKKSWIFALTFLTYAGIYSTRSAWSYCKKNIQQTLEIPNDFLGTIDMMFLLMYAISLNFVGTINTTYQCKNKQQNNIPNSQIDQENTGTNSNTSIDEHTPLQPNNQKKFFKKLKLNMNLKHLLLLGIIPASLIYMSISLFQTYNIKNPWGIVFLMAINGIFQGPAWPSLVNIFGNWFKKGNRGLMMGIWACNSNFGQIVGLQVGHMAIVQYEWGWQACVLITGSFLLIIGILNLIFLEPYPEECGININEDVNNQTNQENQLKGIEQIVTQDSLGDIEQISLDIDENTKLKSTGEQKQDDKQKQEIIQQKTLTYAETFRIPKVLIYTITYSALKSTVYGLLFWLPKYLDENGLQNYSASIAQSMQVGTFCGGILTGCLSDYIGKRSIILAPLLLIASIMMFIIKFYLTSEDVVFYYITIFVIGISLGGPYTLISSTISLDLSEQPQVKGNKSALISITSVIEGSGAFTAAMLQRLIPVVGQANIFFLFFSLCLVATFLLSSIAKNELGEIKIAKQYLKNISQGVSMRESQQQKQIQMVQISQQPLKKLKD